MNILTKLKEAIPKKKRGDASAPNESGVAICPNPKCRRKIGEPILLRDLSTTPTKQYYACPHCFIKMDVISAQPQKKEEKRRKKKKEEPAIKPPRKEEKGPSKCAGYLGYLAGFPKNKPILQECLTYPKVLDCVMKKVTLNKTNLSWLRLLFLGDRSPLSIARAQTASNPQLLYRLPCHNISRGLMKNEI